MWGWSTRRKEQNWLWSIPFIEVNKEFQKFLFCIQTALHVEWPWKGRIRRHHRLAASWSFLHYPWSKTICGIDFFKVSFYIIPRGCCLCMINSVYTNLLYVFFFSQMVSAKVFCVISTSIEFVLLSISHCWWVTKTKGVKMYFAT